MILQELTERQREAVWNSNAWLNIFDGSVRAGKTVASLVRWVKKVREAPDGDFLMVGKTERTLKRNAIDPLIEMLGPDRCRLIAGSGELVLLGRRVYLAGRDYLDRARDLDLYRIRFRLRDNTTLTEKYIRNITNSYVGLWRKRYIEGEWVAAEGAIYGDVWNPEKHIEEEVPGIIRTWSGIDYGTTNPFVEMVTGLGVDGRLHVMAEWRWDSREKQRSLTAGQYGRRLRLWHEKIKREPEWVFIDPEEAAFRIELQQTGWRGVRAADNAVLEGIRLQADLLARDKLRIHRSCRGLIDELPGYVWDPEADGDVPIKADDHSLDAARYSILSSEFLWRRQVLGNQAA